MVRHAHIKLGREHAKLDELYRVLNSLKAEFKRLIVCVDALDECNDSEDFIAACRRFPFNTSFLFIGRHSISQQVTQGFPSTIHQVLEPQKEDIYAAIFAKIQNDKEHQPDLMPDWLMVEIAAEISTLANGM